MLSAKRFALGLRSKMTRPCTHTRHRTLTIISFYLTETLKNPKERTAFFSHLPRRTPPRTLLLLPEGLVVNNGFILES